MSKNLFDIYTINNFEDKYCRDVLINDGLAEISIIGNPVVGQFLGIKIDVDDTDGNGNLLTGNDIYEWKSGNKVVGNNKTYKITEDDIGNRIIVNVTYIDGKGFTDTITAGPTDTIPNLNDGPGVFIIVGEPIVGETLFSELIIDDPDDGIFNINNYLWKSDNNIVGTDETYIIKTSDIGNRITLTVNYIDGEGFNETVVTNPTDVIINNNLEESIEIDLTLGWNWISFNLYSNNTNLNNDIILSDNILTENINDIEQDRILIKNKDSFSQYLDDYQKWIGSLENYNMDDCFMVFLNTNNNDNFSNKLRFNGTILYNYEIDLTTGWNWIGFPEKNQRPLADVINNGNNGDFIKSQTDFSEYYEGIGWFGNLDTLTPLKGYLYKSQQNFTVTYNKNNNLKITKR